MEFMKVNNTFEKLNAIIETSTDWVWEVDISGKYTYVSGKVYEILGYTPEELIGKTPFDFMPEYESKKLKIKFQEIVKNQDKIINLENENLNKNGESIFLLTNGIPIYNDNHKLIGYFGTDKNITKEKNLYNQLIHSEKLSSIGVMSSALAHEFNNILTIMSTSIQMLELKSQENKNCNFENCNLKNIQKQIIKAKELISNVKNFSRVTNEQKEKIILNDLFNEIIKLEQINCKNKNIKIILENKSNTKLFLNSGHFQQVILNLFENSFYALRNKNHGTIKIKIEENKDNIIILFSDDGEGIPEKNKDKIFNSFFTSKNNKTEEINGTGLGMYVSQEIINSYNGNISVKSEINKGTEFIITIPIKINL